MATATVLASRLVLPERTLTSDALFKEYAAFVWRVLRRLGVPDADVEDVCQEVFVAVHRQLPQFEGRSKPSTWIYAIAMRRAASYRRTAMRKREQPLEQVELEREPAPSAADELQRVELRAALDRLLDRLDEDKRAVFVLYEIEELDMREVAEIVGCPLQTAYSRLYAARERLRRAAEQAGGPP
jgi:RNA polymerase sigma-70 factor, ECF subfamily